MWNYHSALKHLEYQGKVSETTPAYNVWDGDDYAEVPSEAPVTFSMSWEEYDLMLTGKRQITQDTLSKITERQAYAMALGVPLAAVLRSSESDK
jgi:hypothetical protein